MPKQQQAKSAAPYAELLADDLREVIGQFVRAVRSQASAPSDARAETLSFLERGGPVSIAVLADRRGVTHQSMRLVIARLASEGWVELVADPQDRRGYLVHLTRKGIAENDAARKGRAEWIADALVATMTPTEMATLNAAVPLLQRIVDLAQH